MAKITISISKEARGINSGLLRGLEIFLTERNIKFSRGGPRTLYFLISNEKDLKKLSYELGYFIKGQTNGKASTQFRDIDNTLIIKRARKVIIRRVRE